MNLFIVEIMLEHSLYLVVNVLSSESELLVKHLVRSRESEALETEYLTVCAYKTFKVYRKTCSKTEDLCTARKDLLLVLLWLAAEEIPAATLMMKKA